MIEKLWYRYFEKSAIPIVIIVIALSLLSAWGSMNVRFSFSFEQFFKPDDPHLNRLNDFKSNFGGDDDFVLIAVQADQNILDSSFLNRISDFTEEANDFDFISKSKSLTNLYLPIKTPFGITTRKLIYLDRPSQYKDGLRLLDKFPEIRKNLVDEEEQHLMIVLQISESLNLRKARILKNEIEEEIQKYHFEDYYTVGRPYFQTELVDMQIRELRMSTAIALLLVCIVFLWIFRRISILLIGFSAIGFSFLIFCGYMYLFDRTFSAIASLYPLILIIVGTSDVIHILSKYLDESQHEKDSRVALSKTVADIGLATFYTSITTAVGFLSLMASKIAPIKEFGFNAAVGVLIAYLVSMLFVSSLIHLFHPRVKGIRKKSQSFWNRNMGRIDMLGKHRPGAIVLLSVLIVLVSIYGIKIISTNYLISSSLPEGSKITRDFKFFEENFSGFRPFEFLIVAKDPYEIDQIEVLREIDKLEKHLKGLSQLDNVISPLTAMNILNSIFYSNGDGQISFLNNQTKLKKLRDWSNRVPFIDQSKYLNRESNKARVSSQIKDIGADSVLVKSQRVISWANNKIDTSMISIESTGIGMLIDQNAQYVRQNLLKGLLIALFAVSFLMVLLFRSMRMLIVALIPNVIPLLIAGALIGFTGIKLDATISIIFVVVFGIAVDDSIHFLSKFKLCRNKGLSIDESLSVTFKECGKPIIITSLLLFAGFLILLFSIHPPSVVVGLLVSITLLSALLCDLFLLPVLIRYILKKD